MTPQLLARKDHTRNRYKSGVAIADALGQNWRDLSDDAADKMAGAYRDAWWGQDERENAA